MGEEVDKLLEQYAPLVKQTAWTVSPGAARDEDALQQGLIGLWEAALCWDGARPFAPLARRCIRNNIIDYLRGKRMATEGLREELAAPAAEEAESAEELKERICRLFPRRSRERKILLSLLAGKKKADIALRLGISRSTVQRTARRAWEKLKKSKE